MIKILQEISGSGKTKHYAKLYGNTPYGDYLLLKEEYRLLDPTHHSNIIKWELKLTIHNEFLSKLQKQNKSLKCVYCGKDNLKRQGKRNVIATVDHFFPKCLPFINPIDTKNFVVSCYKCNNKKSNIIYSLDTLKYINHYKNHNVMINNLIEIKLKNNIL